MIQCVLDIHSLIGAFGVRCLGSMMWYDVLTFRPKFKATKLIVFRLAESRKLPSIHFQMTRHNKWILYSAEILFQCEDGQNHIQSFNKAQLV